jgi:hypothetical protein
MGIMFIMQATTPTPEKQITLHEFIRACRSTRETLA